jgi:hypothetical protein
METIHEAAMLAASVLTARQLQEAINIVEAEFGPPDGNYSAWSRRCCRRSREITA